MLFISLFKFLEAHKILCIMSSFKPCTLYYNNNNTRILCLCFILLLLDVAYRTETDDTKEVPDNGVILPIVSVELITGLCVIFMI